MRPTMKDTRMTNTSYLPMSTVSGAYNPKPFQAQPSIFCGTPAAASNGAVDTMANIAMGITIAGAAVALGSLVYSLWPKKSEPVTPEDKKLDEVDKSTATLDNAIDTADKSKNYDALATSVKQSWTEYNANVKALETADATIEAAKKEVTTAEANAKEAQTALDTADKGVKSAKEKFSGAKDALSDAKGLAKAENETDEAFKTRKDKAVADATTLLKTAQSELDDAEKARIEAQDKKKIADEAIPKATQAVQDATDAKKSLEKANVELKAKIEEANKVLDKRGKSVANSVETQAAATAAGVKTDATIKDEKKDTTTPETKPADGKAETSPAGTKTGPGASGTDKLDGATPPAAQAPASTKPIEVVRLVTSGGDTKPEETTKKEPTTIEFKKGDTLLGIAGKLKGKQGYGGMSTWQIAMSLKEDNQITDPTKIPVGFKLKV